MESKYLKLIDYISLQEMNLRLLYWLLWMITLINKLSEAGGVW